MATDRELLEAAAKAAGLDLAKWQEETGCMYFPFGSKLTDNHLWNPLADDGDAMRLAVHFRMSVVITDVGVSARCLAPSGNWADEKCGAGDDIAAATRRSVVRAAVDMARIA